jgi:hypothetical protein
MTKKKDKKDHKKRGQPSKYKEDYAEQAGKMCLLGYTDVELAFFFDVSEDTIYEWKKRHPKFSEAIKENKEAADARVARRLYERAMGYETHEDVIFQYRGEPVVVPTTKKYPPETVAGIFWLKNRQKEKWRERTDVNLGGQSGNPVTVQIIDQFVLPPQDLPSDKGE